MARTDSNHQAAPDAAPKFLDEHMDVLDERDHPGCSWATLQSMNSVAQASRGISAIATVLRVNIGLSDGSDTDAPPPLTHNTVEGLLLAIESLSATAYAAAEATADAEARRTSH